MVDTIKTIKINDSKTLTIIRNVSTPHSNVSRRYSLYENDIRLLRNLTFNELIHFVGIIKKGA